MLPRLDKKRPLVVFTHFPWGLLVPLRSTNADAVLERFQEHNLQGVFNGHYHGSSQRKLGNAAITTKSSLSSVAGVTSFSNSSRPP